MILKSLSIYRAESYMQNAGKLHGTIKFQSDCGTVELDLNDELSQKLVEVCADQIVESAKDIATNMSREVIARPAQPAIEKE